MKQVEGLTGENDDKDVEIDEITRDIINIDRSQNII